MSRGMHQHSRLQTTNGGFRGLIYALALLFSAMSAAYSASMTASLDRANTTVGEAVTLSVEFEGGQPQGPVQMPAVTNLTIQSAGDQNFTQIINGQVTQKFIKTFSVIPKVNGQFIIPSLRAVVNGQQLVTQPLRLVVGQQDPSEIDKYTRFHFLVPKTDVFLNEPLPVEIQILFKVQGNMQEPQLDAQGFTLGKWQQQPDTVVNEESQQWHMFSFKSYALAARTGQLALGPATMQLDIPAQLQRNFFGQVEVARWRTVTLSAPAKTINVMALPTDNVPPTFNGAIGTYKMTVSASPTNVAVGDPITLKVEISGQGPVETLTLPDQPDWRDFKVYPPTSSVNTTDPLGLAGSKSFELTLVAQNTEVKAIPPFVYTYFDTRQRAYQSLTGPNIPLIVRPSAAAQLPSFASTTTNSNTPPSAADIVHIKPHLGTVVTAGSPVIQQAWFWVLQSVPVVLWAGLWIRRRRADELANNPRLRRRREAARTIEKGLAELPQFAAEKKTEEFFAGIFRLLQERLGERLDLPASAITEAVIDERLRPLNTSENTMTGLEELFQACNQARYARQRTSEELAAFIPKVETVLRELEQVGGGK